MKIIVKNDKERDLIKRFIKALVELDGIEEVEKIDHEGDLDETYVWSDEYRLIREELSTVKIDIDEYIKEMTFDDSSVVIGKCMNCGVQTEGTSNDEEITYSEYLYYMSDEIQNTWKCEKCFIKALG
jgi:hypothetical protein